MKTVVFAGETELKFGTLGQTIYHLPKSLGRMFHMSFLFAKRQRYCHSFLYITPATWKVLFSDPQVGSL